MNIFSVKIRFEIKQRETENWEEQKENAKIFEERRRKPTENFKHNSFELDSEMDLEPVKVLDFVEDMVVPPCMHEAGSVIIHILYSGLLGIREATRKDISVVKAKGKEAMAEGFSRSAIKVLTGPSIQVQMMCHALVWIFVGNLS